MRSTGGQIGRLENISFIFPKLFPGGFAVRDNCQCLQNVFERELGIVGTVGRLASRSESEVGRLPANGRYIALKKRQEIYNSFYGKHGNYSTLAGNSKKNNPKIRTGLKKMGHFK